MTNKVSGYRTDQIDYKYVLRVVIHGKTARRGTIWQTNVKYSVIEVQRDIKSRRWRYQDKFKFPWIQNCHTERPWLGSGNNLNLKPCKLLLLVSSPIKFFLHHFRILFRIPYLSIEHPTRWLNIWTLRVGAYLRLGAYQLSLPTDKRLFEMGAY